MGIPKKSANPVRCSLFVWNNVRQHCKPIHSAGALKNADGLLVTPGEILLILTPMRLDAATLVFATSLLAGCLALLAALLGRSPELRRFGMLDWAVSMSLAAAAFYSFSLRDIGSVWLTYLFSNLMMLGIIPFSTRAFGRLVTAPNNYFLQGMTVVLGWMGVLLVFFREYAFHFGIFSMSAALAMQLFISLWSLHKAGGWFASPIRTLLFFLHSLAAGAFLVRAAMASNGNAALVSAVANSSVQVSFLLVSIMYLCMSSIAFIVMACERQQRELGERLRRDSLTGLYTRTAFYELAAQQHALLQRTGYACVLMDVDSFKGINDRWGHAAGDAVLAHCGRMVTQLSRISDVSVRYGGEEFCVLLPGCAEAEAARFAQRLVDEAGKQQVRLRDGQRLQFTVSVGYACAPALGGKNAQEEPLDDVIDRADRALYAAKTAGKNQSRSGNTFVVTTAAPLMAC
jgi:diguanylate cyclase (GGDEF)-like protein